MRALGKDTRFLRGFYFHSYDSSLDSEQNIDHKSQIIVSKSNMNKLNAADIRDKDQLDRMFKIIDMFSVHSWCTASK